MRRMFTAVVAGVLTAVTLSAPASAAPVPDPDAALAPAGRTAPSPGSGWELIPSPPFDYPAGFPCAFGLHGDPIEDEVYYRVLTTYPDGSTHTEAAFGPLVYRITNTATGRAVEGDASAQGVLVHHPDGSRTYLNNGPLLVGFRDGKGDLPQGFYQIDGPAWVLRISADNVRTLSGAYRIVQNVCVSLS